MDKKLKDIFVILAFLNRKRREKTIQSFSKCKNAKFSYSEK